MAPSKLVQVIKLVQALNKLVQAHTKIVEALTKIVQARTKIVKALTKIVQARTILVLNRVRRARARALGRRLHDSSQDAPRAPRSI